MTSAYLDRPLRSLAECESQRADRLNARHMTDRPLAAAGLTSYRCKSPQGFGWIMIGAVDRDDAMREARRSNPHAKEEDLQVWNGADYAPVIAKGEGR